MSKSQIYQHGAFFDSWLAYAFSSGNTYILISQLAAHITTWHAVRQYSAKTSWIMFNRLMHICALTCCTSFYEKHDVHKLARQLKFDLVYATRPK